MGERTFYDKMADALVTKVGIPEHMASCELCGIMAYLPDKKSFVCSLCQVSLDDAKSRQLYATAHATFVDDRQALINAKKTKRANKYMS